MVKDADFSGGRSSNGGHNLKNGDIYTLNRYPMVITVTFADVKAQIDSALANKTWLILLFHEVNNSGREYSVTPAFFQQVIDYLESKNVTPITVRQGVQLMQQ